MDNYSGIYLAFCIPEAKICPKAAESSGCLCFHSDRFLDTTSLRRILTKLRLKKRQKKNHHLLLQTALKYLDTFLVDSISWPHRFQTVNHTE